MTDEPTRTDRGATDEPDGTPAYAASLRPAGESVDAPDADADTGADFEDDDADPADPRTAFDGPVPPGASRAGYDVGDVSGDTEAVRPQ